MAKDKISFRCVCGHNWSGTPDRIDDAQERSWHPHRYFASCPACDAETEQAQWELALFKAHTRATGPKTSKGRAASAQNLVGHPTPEESLKTRFNALKHGVYAETATFWPARPGKYSECEHCQFFDGCHNETACMRKMELYMRHHVAFETRDASMLRGLRATLQANIQAIIDSIVMNIIADGVSIKTPQWYHDKDGTLHLAEYTDSAGEHRLIEDIRANPLIKTLGELIARNHMSLGDESMTDQSSSDINTDDAQQTGVTDDELRTWKKRSEQQINVLEKLIGRSQNVINVTPTDG